MSMYTKMSRGGFCRGGGGEGYGPYLEQRRLKPPYTFAQSDLSLHCSHALCRDVE